jgi:hypothetical protein
MTVVDAMSTVPYDVVFAELAASQHALGTLAVGDRRCE